MVSDPTQSNPDESKKEEQVGRIDYLLGRMKNNEEREAESWVYLEQTVTWPPGARLGQESWISPASQS